MFKDCSSRQPGAKCEGVRELTVLPGFHTLKAVQQTSIVSESRGTQEQEGEHEIEPS